MNEELKVTIRAETGDIQSKLQSLRTQLALTQQEVKANQRELNRASKEYDNHGIHVEEAAKAVAKNKQEVESLKKEIKALTAEEKKANEATQDSAKTTEKSNKSVGGLLKSMGKMMLYRAIRAVISSITSAMKEGISAVYQYSRAIGGDLADALDSIKSATTQMKNQFGAASATLLQSLAPAIKTVMSWVTKLADALTQLISAFTGSTYLKADGVSASWEDATSSAKEYQRTVLGMDELNTLSDQNSGSGGSSSSSSGTYTESPIAEGIMSFVSEIKRLWKQSGIAEDWEKLKEAWEAVKNSGLFELIGKILANSTFDIIDNTIILFTDLFNVIADIAVGDWETLINDLWSLLVELGGGPIINTISTILAVIDAITGGNASGAFRDFIARIKDISGVITTVKQAVANLPSTISSAFSSAANSIKNAWSSVASWFTRTVITPIKNAFESIKDFKIKLPHFSITWNYNISSLWGTVANFLFGKKAMPNLNVSWYAKGGIVDGASLIGAGEQGKEAILPLEKNTGALDLIAEKLGAGQQNINVNVDGRKLFEFVVDRNNSVVRSTGASPLLV